MAVAGTGTASVASRSAPEIFRKSCNSSAILARELAARDNSKQSGLCNSSRARGPADSTASGGAAGRSHPARTPRRLAGGGKAGGGKRSGVAARGGETFGVAYRGACKRGCHEELHLLPPPRGARCDVDS